MPYKVVDGKDKHKEHSLKKILSFLQKKINDKAGKFYIVVCNRIDDNYYMIFQEWSGIQFCELTVQNKRNIIFDYKLGFDPDVADKWIDTKSLKNIFLDDLPEEDEELRKQIKYSNRVCSQMFRFYLPNVKIIKQFSWGFEIYTKNLLVLGMASKRIFPYFLYKKENDEYVKLIKLDGEETSDYPFYKLLNSSLLYAQQSYRTSEFNEYNATYNISQLLSRISLLSLYLKNNYSTYNMLREWHYIQNIESEKEKENKFNVGQRNVNLDL